MFNVDSNIGNLLDSISDGVLEELLGLNYMIVDDIIKVNTKSEDLFNSKLEESSEG